MRVTKTGAKQFTFRTSAIQLLALVLVSLIGVLAPRTASAFSGGSGTVGDPFEIATVADLVELNSYSGAAHVGKYFELTADIDLNVAPYNTGAGWTPLASFQGHFDGNNHTISNLYINTTGASKGLFSSLAGATEFKNLAITNASVASNNQNVGILAGGIASRTVTNVSVSGTVTVTGSSGLVGGVTGAFSNATVNNVSSSANITATSAFTAVGGLAGNLTSTIVTNGSSTGSVAGGQYRVGNLIGNADSGSVIRRSFSTGPVSSTGGETGGLIGALYGDLEDSYSRSNVTTANLSKGGLVGFLNDASATIVRSYATGTMSAGTGMGLLGGLYAGTCNSSFWDSQTTGRPSSSCSGAGATAKTTAQMKSVDTFTNTATSTGLTTAWDFTGNPNNDSGNANYWNIDTNGVINDGYPYLNAYVANNTPTVSTLGPSQLVNGSWSTDTTPSFSFTTADANGSDTVQYKIQIDNNSNFASPEVDYTSALAAPGASTFTVGQALGSGSYATGSTGQTLADGQYYWRVKALDNLAADSGYTAANSGSVAFGVDTTAPSVPTNFVYSALTNDTTPNINWDNSTDASGQAVSYLVQWSQAEDFSSIDSTTTSSSDITLGSALEDGEWYFRIKSYDPLSNESAYATAFSLTIETVEPIVESLSPANGANNVGLTDNLIIEFSEPVVVGTGNISIRYESNYGLVEQIDVTSGQVSGSGTDTITINPTDPLEEDEIYFAIVDSATFNDLAGNSFSGINSVGWSFTTVDLQDPTFTAPASDTAANSLAVSFTLNEPPAAGTLQLVLTGEASRTITLTDLSAGTHSFDIDLSNPLLTSQVQSMSGGSSVPDGTYDIALTYQDQTQSVTFEITNTNIILDSTAPSVTGRTPSNGSNAIAVGTNLAIVFDEPVQTHSGQVVIKRLSDGSTVEAIDVATGQITGSGSNTITINPSQDLDMAITYYIEITSSAIRDLVGNNFTGYSSNSSWLFTTQGPNNGRVSVSPNTVEIIEGQSKRVGIILQEPIIGDSTLNLVIDTGGGDLTSNVSVAGFTSAAWLEARDFVLTAVDDSEVNGNRQVEVTLTAVTGSEYYNGFVQTVSVTVVDNDEAVEPAPTNNSDTTANRQNANRSSTPRSIDAGQVAQTAAEPMTKVVLNDLPGYVGHSGAGAEVQTSQGQVLYFMVEGEEHTATINEVAADSVTMVIASTPQTVQLRIGQTDEYDVNDDGVSDIRVTLNSITGGIANMSFKSIGQSQQSLVDSSEATTKPATNVILWVLASGGALIVMVLVVIGRRRMSKG